MKSIIFVLVVTYTNVFDDVPVVLQNMAVVQSAEDAAIGLYRMNMILKNDRYGFYSGTLIKIDLNTASIDTIEIPVLTFDSKGQRVGR